jgi:hypothetical protein
MLKMGILQTVVEKLRIAAPTIKRSPKWPTVRAAHIKKHGKCAACGSTKTLEVHHIEPFHLNPDLELDPKNLITLCESTSNGVICHLFIGHSGDYKAYNPEVLVDAKIALDRITHRPYDKK